MLISNVSYKLTRHEFQVEYPLNTSVVARVEFPQGIQECPEPHEVEIADDRAILTYELRGFKPLYEKALYFHRTSQTFASQQIDALMAFLCRLVGKLSLQEEILGIFTLRNVFYCNDEFCVLGLLPRSLLRICPILYYREQEAASSDALPLKVALYQLLTSRTPLVPFMSNFPIGDVPTMSVSGHSRLKAYFATRTFHEICGICGETQEKGRDVAVLTGTPVCLLSVFTQPFVSRDDLAAVLEGIEGGFLKLPEYIKQEEC